MPSTPFHLEPIRTDQYVVLGDVVIADGVVIAPGVLLQADAGAKIVVGGGVCLGMGCVIHAQGGVIQVEPGANLGAGVLIVAQGTIGRGAIVGAGSTVYGASIAAGQVVAPMTLMIDDATNTASSVFSNPPINAAMPRIPDTEPEVAESQNSAANSGAEKTKVAVEGNGFFYRGGANGTKSNASEPIADPWATPESTFKSPQYEDAWKSPETEPLQPQVTTDPIAASTFVYPEDTYQPKPAWQVSANADLGQPPQPSPDSDLSATEMQGNDIPRANPAIDQGTLVKHSPKQVYGQAYVNQMLGKMMGKRDL
ncbi:MAG: carbon dioxide concentrating mechanism protein [Cyanobacteriota bacterium]|jgi:carbon dioxide concentrating mechanism protein CcmN